jgi:hypothetical protein
VYSYTKFQFAIEYVFVLEIKTVVDDAGEIAVEE